MVRHLAIIMDGNRRFAQRLLNNPLKGHVWGRDKLKEVGSWAREAGIKELTLYAFSAQNFSRPKKEFDHLMQLFREGCDELLAQDSDGVRVRFVGDLERFPEDVHERMKHVMARTQHHTEYVMNVCVGYGGREEITAAVKELAREVQQGLLSSEDISMQTISDRLEISEPDLIIRTGGEVRTSNFLVWQSWYSEWFFVDTLWPDFSKEEFDMIIEEFSARKRRFGR